MKWKFRNGCVRIQKTLYFTKFSFFFFLIWFFKKDKKKCGRSKARREGRRAVDSQFRLLMNAGSAEASSLCLNR